MASEYPNTAMSWKWDKDKSTIHCCCIFKLEFFLSNQPCDSTETQASHLTGSLLEHPGLNPKTSFWADSITIRTKVSPALSAKLNLLLTKPTDSRGSHVQHWFVSSDNHAHTLQWCHINCQNCSFHLPVHHVEVLKTERHCFYWGQISFSHLQLHFNWGFYLHTEYTTICSTFSSSSLFYQPLHFQEMLEWNRIHFMC